MTLKEALAETLKIWWRRSRSEFVRQLCPMCIYQSEISKTAGCDGCIVRWICESRWGIVSMSRRDQYNINAFVTYIRLVRLWKDKGFGSLPKGARP